MAVQPDNNAVNNAVDTAVSTAVSTAVNTFASDLEAYQWMVVASSRYHSATTAVRHEQCGTVVIQTVGTNWVFIQKDSRSLSVAVGSSKV